MYSINYGIMESLEDYKQLISNYSIFLSFFLAMIIFSFLLWINRKTKVAFSLTLLALVLFIISSFYFRGMELFNHIDTIFSWEFYKNIYFYYWNMFLCFLLIHLKLSSKKSDKISILISLVFFCLLATNAIFQLYITSVVKGNRFLVLGNTGSMIIIGNLLSFVFYLYLIVYKIVSFIQKK